MQIVELIQMESKEPLGCGLKDEHSSAWTRFWSHGFLSGFSSRQAARPRPQVAYNKAMFPTLQFDPFLAVR